jgi:hypothetical protein
MDGELLAALGCDDDESVAEEETTDMTEVLIAETAETSAGRDE